MNDTLRLLFSVMLGFSLLMLWKNWEDWQAREAAATAAPSTAAISAQSGSGAVPAAVAPAANGAAGDGDLPVATQNLRSSVAPQEQEGEVPLAAAVAPGRQITIQTDWLSAVVSENGGNLSELRLKKHLHEDAPLLLLESEARQYIAQSGLIGAPEAPNHNHLYTLVGAADARTADKGSEVVTVQLRTTSGKIELTKTYVFHRADYLISLHLRAKNLADAPVQLHGYFQLAHDGTLPRDYSSLLPTFFGAAMFTEDSKFVKIAFEDIGEDAYPRKSDNGWIGVIQRYFAAVWLPPIDSGEREFFMRKSTAGGARLGVILPFGILPSGEEREITSRLFAGAQEQKILKQLHDSGDAPGINLVVDYGWLTFIAVLLFELLSLIQSGVHNWGVSIILLTLSVKLLFYPLSSAAYRSMAKMKEEAPRIKQMQEKYGHDKQRMQQEMMALYREKKINPVGGCLPILVQIPVFIALYWVLLGSVELRQAPFAGWIQDLSAPDPFFILPLIMGASMFLQTKLSPAPPDPTQAMIMKVMPIGFAVFSVFFPAGLVLYWAVNTILSIAQQWYITRSLERSKKTT